MEKILNIREVENFTLPDDYRGYDGYVIKTNVQEIIIGIDNYQSCCEDWGHLTSEDNFDDFIGAELLSVEVVDGEYKSEKITLSDYFSVDECIFVNVQTTEGTLQFVLYNSHNGYYGHKVVISSNQIKYDSYL